jgi:hypothetical protein
MIGVSLFEFLQPPREKYHHIDFENDSSWQYLRQLWTFGRLKNQVNSAQAGKLLKYLG